MCKSRWFWGRRGTMIIGALVTMAFFFAYTQVRTNKQQLGFTCAISFSLVRIALMSRLVNVVFTSANQKLSADTDLCRTFTMDASTPTHRKFCPLPTVARVMAFPLVSIASWAS